MLQTPTKQVSILLSTKERHEKTYQKLRIGARVDTKVKKPSHNLMRIFNLSFKTKGQGSRHSL